MMDLKAFKAKYGFDYKSSRFDRYYTKSDYYEFREKQYNATSLDSGSVAPVSEVSYGPALNHPNITLYNEGKFS
jgi:hypothetical protein